MDPRDKVLLICCCSDVATFLGISSPSARNEWLMKPAHPSEHPGGHEETKQEPFWQQSALAFANFCSAFPFLFAAIWSRCKKCARKIWQEEDSKNKGFFFCKRVLCVYAKKVSLQGEGEAIINEWASHTLLGQEKDALSTLEMTSRVQMALNMV